MEASKTEPGTITEETITSALATRHRGAVDATGPWATGEEEEEPEWAMVHLGGSRGLLLGHDSLVVMDSAGGAMVKLYAGAVDIMLGNLGFKTVPQAWAEIATCIEQRLDVWDDPETEDVILHDRKPRTVMCVERERIILASYGFSEQVGLTAPQVVRLVAAIFGLSR